jgi:DNA helicase HerA-like ATPase
MWSERELALPVLLVCEEAHRYIPRDPDAGFGPTRKAISRIAKEGRKYGVSLCLVTQRPSELSQTILSQCNTLFALRMSNDQDQEFVRRALPESAAGMLNALPALRTQEAVVVGEGVTLPMRVRFDTLDEFRRPQSETAAFSHAWSQEVDRGEDFVAATLDRWRRQVR